MTISCEIIKDLLPLYHDGVCSNDSKALVEEHLAKCDSCRAELQAMEGKLFVNHKEHNLQEAEVVQSLSRKWKKGMLKSLLKGVLTTLVFVTVLVLVLYLFIDVRVVPKP